MTVNHDDDCGKNLTDLVIKGRILLRYNYIYNSWCHNFLENFFSQAIFHVNTRLYFHSAVLKTKLRNSSEQF